MHVSDAQRELRSAYLGGFAGQLVSALLWAGSGALSVGISRRVGILFLVGAGFFIYPLTQLSLRLMGRPGKVGPDNALSALGAQVAFVLPLTLPLVAAAALHRIDWFYPAFMVALGAHYLPFVFLYGMRMFGVLAILLWAAGGLLGTVYPLGFSAGAWITAAVMAVFAVVGRSLVLREERERTRC
jgi:hypothetical protein